MMKVGRILLAVGILFALFNLNYGSDVVQKDDFKFCRQSMTLSGNCQNSPTCFTVFNAKYGASATTHNCNCQDAGKSHTCSCCINCDYTDGKTPC
ncbi:unnamed protein product [Trifolium pratense]|uniref:Uncharacterized protein n=1 Tax=Trifolium pratense TaxID=57577 RepID=A0ACB0LTC4_TRIPR|nr:unnamed protein product [Trifolium pratense]